MTAPGTTHQPDTEALIGFIMQTATQEDISRIREATNVRSKYLGTIAAANVVGGKPVRLDRLSPKVLNGLTGEVSETRGARCDVLLDTDSTRRLAFSRVRIAPGALDALNENRGYLLRGVPRACAEPIS